MIDAKQVEVITSLPDNGTLSGPGVISDERRAIEGKSGCEMVNCRYAHRNEGGIATCLAPGDFCIRRQDCPAPQPSVTREDADFNAKAIYRADDLGSAKGLMRAMLRDLGVRIEGENQ